MLSFWRQYLAISPFYLIFIVFSFVPVFYSLYLSFQRYDGLGTKQFVGLQQFEFLWNDPVFWLSIRNTLAIWVLSTVPTLFGALVLAALLHSVRRFKGFYRIALYVPNVTSIVAVAIFFGAVFSNDFGLVNAILGTVGISPVRWLSDPWLIKVVIALLMTWMWTGYNMIIYLAGLQAIPQSVYEAARMDGAGPIRTFFQITVPIMRPIILFTVVISTINGLQSFSEPQVLFASNAANQNLGGPGQAGLTTLLYFYQSAFLDNDYGYGAAIVWAFFVLIIVLVVVNWRIVQRGRKS
ncbi:carbohydrate ABC transporter permease [Streptomyces europaeiscabiei]|uniref:carbohydrate ABC transporter permease n=1 Tax=Streptomyces europaeiscabiei TaxID=146819 RepID=UPI0007C69C1D|nr:sugar ABC transporter permease [Streptomyces europaeiscabiei]MDX2527130.1 sugar ABC transporter permease [Streptomyces europaeiscabiei]MDX2767484.1 sugar ABC transporter permease [Streptomyces europaeiscabiei]MDX3665406.1 sugar ABC transporter permease [Streptomyces europaeiscabiei]MDX3835458.1 sugar ABC transporter permease [Streptomyces europaeiscabiei]